MATLNDYLSDIFEKIYVRNLSLQRDTVDVFFIKNKTDVTLKRFLFGRIELNITAYFFKEYVRHKCLENTDVTFT